MRCTNNHFNLISHLIFFFYLVLQFTFVFHVCSLWLSSNCSALTDDRENCHFNSYIQTSEETSALSQHFRWPKLSEWVLQMNPSHPRGAFTGTFPEESLSQTKPVWLALAHTVDIWPISHRLLCYLRLSSLSFVFASQKPVWHLFEFSIKGFFPRLGDGCCHFIFLRTSPQIGNVLFSWDWQ